MMLQPLLELFKKELAAKIALLFFIFLTIWWFVINFVLNRNNADQNQLFAAVYGFMALWGAIWGILGAKKWGFASSVMGRAMLFFSVGLLAQEFGQLAYSYYIYFLKITVPYPSIGDIGFFSSIPLYIYGTYLLAKASGAKISLRSFKYKIQAFLIPGVMLLISYLLFLQSYSFDWNNPIKIFLDFGYPMGQAIYISLALLTFFLTKNILGGIMKFRILFILFALIVQYISDYSFLYQSNRGLWLVGSYNDYSYLVSYLLMTIAMIELKSIASKLN